MRKWTKWKLPQCCSKTFDYLPPSDPLTLMSAPSPWDDCSCLCDDIDLNCAHCGPSERCSTGYSSWYGLTPFVGAQLPCIHQDKHLNIIHYYMVLLWLYYVSHPPTTTSTCTPTHSILTLMPKSIYFGWLAPIQWANGVGAGGGAGDKQEIAMVNGVFGCLRTWNTSQMENVRRQKWRYSNHLMLPVLIHVLCFSFFVCAPCLCRKWRCCRRTTYLTLTLNCNAISSCLEL